MITVLALIATLLLAAILVLLVLLAISDRIDKNLKLAHENIHRIRAGFERERHRFQELCEAIHRIDQQNRRKKTIAEKL